MAGNVSQMYHQIHLRPGDRPLHRFLYRDLGTGDTPKVYEFKRFILEGVTAHFVSSLLGNIMPDLTRRLTHWELMQFQNTVKWMI